MSRRPELAAFLKIKRDSTATRGRTEVAPGRRRVPGLRREEVAEEVGISVEWYARLEQGREIRASPKTIDAISDVLALSDVERTYVQILSRPPASKVEVSGATEATPASVQQMIREMLATPAYVMNSRWKMIDWNTAASTLFGDPRHFGGHERNCLWQHFIGEPFSRLLVNRAEILPYVTALFRFATAQDADAAWRHAFVSDLCARSQEFASLWSKFRVADWGECKKLFDHPRLGRLTFTNVSHRVSGMSGPLYRIVTYVPDPATETRQKILSLTSS